MAPSPSLNWLAALKGTQLKALAAAVGTASSGTKSTLLSHLHEHLQNGLLATGDGHETSRRSNRQSQKEQDIISIDMGIRNLAYCHIQLLPNWSSSTSKKASLPIVKQWSRFAISSLKINGSATELSSGSSNVSASTPPPSNTETTTDATSSPREAFDPLTYSSHAYNLIKHILPLPPLHSPPSNISNTHILIERQRFRSMGGPTVQEWTLRVNMFEAMLYAVLRTFQEMGLWHGSVHPVVPGRVGKFWVGDEEDQDEVAATTTVDEEDSGEDEGGESSETDGEIRHGSKRKGKGKVGAKSTGKKSRKSSTSKAVRMKTAKIKKVEDWLDSIADEGGDLLLPPMFELEGQAKDTAAAFLEKRRGGSRKKNSMAKKAPDAIFGEKSEGAGMEREIGKLDDLADCLMQGMAWVKWEENRRRVLEMGEKGLKGVI